MNKIIEEKKLTSRPPRVNIRKNGIFVGISRQWMGNDESWVITGFAENDTENKIKKEATDAIKAVNAQYGYAPEFLSISRQVGAVIASIDRITHPQDLSTAVSKEEKDRDHLEDTLNERIERLEKENKRLKKRLSKYTSRDIER